MNRMSDLLASLIAELEDAANWRKVTYGFGKPLHDRIIRRLHELQQRRAEEVREERCEICKDADSYMASEMWVCRQWDFVMNANELSQMGCYLCEPKEGRDE